MPQFRDSHSTLGDAILAIGAEMSRHWGRVRTGEPVAVIKARAKIEKLHPDIEPSVPQPSDLRRTWREIKQHWDEHQSLEGLSRSQLRMSPWVMFFPAEQPSHWLGSDAQFVEAWLALLRTTGRAGWLAAMLDVFMEEYPYRMPSFDTFRQGLYQLVSDFNSPRLASRQRRNARFSVLEPQGPEDFARAWTGGRIPIDVMRDHEPIRDNCGYFYAVYEKFLGELSRLLRASRIEVNQLKHVGELFKNRVGGLRFPERRHEMAEALLLPFDGQNPHDSIKSFIQELLRPHFGHPQVRPQDWSQVALPARRVMLRWLGTQSFKAFLDVVDKITERDPTADRVWPYRRKFWEAYQDRGYIDEAWVILGSEAKQLAASLPKGTLGACGTLTGASKIHCSLLFRIGPLTINEWSHKGKCRIWMTDHERVHPPELYREEYRAESLKGFAYREIVHNGSENGKWQREVAAHIFMHTNITVPSNAWRL